MDGIYVETRAMRDGLTRLGLDNVKWLPNFRQFDRHMPRLQRTPSVPLRLVFCARVFKEKGIEEAIEAVRLVNGNAASPAVVLDVYGPVEAVYQERFPQVLEGARHVQYKGVLPTESVHSTLQHYDLLLFPTYYSDEGFPGTIVDAYVAGLPVLATDWRYNRELVEHGVTGALYQPQSAVALAVAIGKYVEAPQLIERMRPWCVAEAEHYHVERAVGALIRDFEGRRSDVPAASPGDMRRAV
jgi:glycosyltransferase involved in cell wall biosynthesis